MNVSCALMRTDHFCKSMDELGADFLTMEYAGDWLLYSYILENGNISYVSDALNIHRRHAKSVTLQSLKKNDGAHRDEAIRVRKCIEDRLGGIDPEIAAIADQFISENF